MRRSILGNPVVQFLIGRAIGGLMLLVGITTRWKRINEAAAAQFWNGEGRVILCLWHGRFALTHKCWRVGRGRPVAKMLISQSPEGGIVAHTSRAVGAGVIRGSAAKRGQQKGGVEATREMARHLEEGGVVAMTPDGPRGPRMRARKGPVQVAKISGVPLLPMIWSTHNRVVFKKSWDQFILPLPFGRGALIWGDPIAPPAPDASDAELEAVRLKLENELNRISAEADRLAGVEAIEPAPLRQEAARNQAPAPT
ncbi:MAG: lysophospholipid acyltransferase family protein [Hyphomonadaceae bacterium]